MKKILALAIILAAVMAPVAHAEQGVYDLTLGATSGNTMAPSGSSPFIINGQAGVTRIEQMHRRVGNVSVQVKPGGVTVYHHGQGGSNSGVTFSVWVQPSHYDTPQAWAGAEKIYCLSGVSLVSGSSVYVVSATIPPTQFVRFGVDSGVTPPYDIDARATVW